MKEVVVTTGSNILWTVFLLDVNSEYDVVAMLGDVDMLVVHMTTTCSFLIISSW